MTNASMQRNLLEYHKSIAEELQVAQNQIRNLIGSAHWQSDGEHKEAVLRKTLRAHLPETVQVGKGFVCYPDGETDTSRQIDILLTSRAKPALFRDGEMTVVTPDAVEAIIEVKTNLAGAQIEETLRRLANDAERIRRLRPHPPCGVGLFVFGEITANDEQVLNHLINIADGSPDRAVSWIAAGPDRFFRFWTRGTEDVYSPVGGPVWHSYQLDGLAHAYFVSNAVCDISGNVPRAMEFPWFPIPGGKEVHRRWYAQLEGDGPHRFPGDQ